MEGCDTLSAPLELIIWFHGLMGSRRVLKFYWRRVAASSSSGGDAVVLLLVGLLLLLLLMLRLVVGLGFPLLFVSGTSFVVLACGTIDVASISDVAVASVVDIALASVVDADGSVGSDGVFPST